MNLKSVAEAADEKKCTKATLYQALDSERLTEFRVGKSRLIVNDEKYRAFEVLETGGRSHKTYQRKTEDR